MFLVSIDPGLSTGVALFSASGQLLRSLTTNPPHDELRAILVDLGEHDKFEFEVVIEQGPLNRKQADLCAPVEEMVKGLATNIQWVRPTDWKPHPKAQLGAGDKPATRHESDAVRIGRWYLTTRSQNATPAVPKA